MPERLTTPPDMAHVLEMALTMPGELGNTYSRFYDYSFANQVLLWMQGVTEPVNTYNRWQAMDHQVKRGSQAKAIWRPIFGKVETESGDERKLTGFKLQNCLFTLSETDGEPLPELAIPEWSPDRALGSLAISRVAFDMADGNVQGYAHERTVAVSPVAKYPLKTLMHEVAHIQHGHTTEQELEDYRAHRGLKEGEAEGSGYLVMNALEVDEAWDASESRAYIRHWMNGDRPPDTSIRRIMSVGDQILRAGRPAKETV